MVPTFQCSAKKSRRILARTSGAITGPLPRQGGDRRSAGADGGGRCGRACRGGRTGRPAPHRAQQRRRGRRPGVSGNMGRDLPRRRRRRGARGRRGAHHRRRGRLPATVMRHFRATALAVSPLACRVRRPPVEALLVPLPGGAEARPTGLARAGRPAVAVAPVAAHGRGRRPGRTPPARRPRTATIPSALGESAWKWTDERQACDHRTAGDQAPCLNRPKARSSNSGPSLFRPADR